MHIGCLKIIVYRIVGIIQVMYWETSRNSSPLVHMKISKTTFKGLVKMLPMILRVLDGTVLEEIVT